jgi:hypothetical protein
LIKYIKEKCPKPRLSEEAKYQLNQYYVNIRASYGSPRILKTIFEIAKNIARLKLKHEVDAADAKEAMEFYNYILLQLNKVVAVPSNPRDIAYEQCLEIIKETLSPILFEEVINSACERNPQVSRYIGLRRKLRDNAKLRPILEMLENHSHVNLVHRKPVVLEYMVDKVEVKVEAGSDDDKDGNGVDVCDPCDACDDRSETPDKNNDQEIFSRVSGEASHISHTSHYSSDISNDSVGSCPYAHLIEIEYLPNLEKTAYR